MGWVPAGVEALEKERLKVEELRLSARNKELEERRIQREKKGA